MKPILAILLVLGIGCVDATGGADSNSDLGLDLGTTEDMRLDFALDLNEFGSDGDFETVEDVAPPFCNSASDPIAAAKSEQDFYLPSLNSETREISNQDWNLPWENGAADISGGLVAIVGDEGRQRGLRGAWVPYGEDLNFHLIDYYADSNTEVFPKPDPEILPPYLAVSVLVDHKSVEAEYSWDWRGMDYQSQSLFMKVPHESEQTVKVRIPASAFPEARAYDIVVFFFKPNALSSEMIQMFRMTLYYGGFDIPEHPCIPLAEGVELSGAEKAYEERGDWYAWSNRISVYHEDPAESHERESLIEVPANATSVSMNMLLRGTSRENFALEHVPMKIVTFVDYEVQDDPILIGLPQEDRTFAHRDQLEVDLNPGPETIVWVAGIYNPWIPAVSWNNIANPDIQGLYWAYRSNRLIFRRAAE
ncbi:hypothetical protein FRD01_11855 [Microvenator marinus]|uniref:Uncharacterized protein n=1 Tax=Microvenator marinus TaxID=2600177 RepID=A0A5B8XSS1_9DELT|nr:hypothetical protein [Microvenator marinus]QED27918.1 hypothetical protein FRD01_11855 [Microvenator marinus]